MVKIDMEEKEVCDENSYGIKVHIRLKQCEEKESTRYHVFGNGTQLHVPNMKGRLELDRWYGFDHVYSKIASNKEVYRRSSYGLVESALNGYNTALFAYGQSGSGKTHTLMSKDGVTARIVSHLFNRIWRNQTLDYKVSCSYFQIYNEQIYDLLNPRNAECFIREEASGEVFVDNMVNVLCETPMDVYELINIGRKSLVIGETKMGRLNSGSHAVCQLSIEKRQQFDGKRKRSMQETYMQDGTRADCDENDSTSNGLDFHTTPFEKVELKKRHKVATNKVNEKKAIFRVPSASSLSPRLSSRGESLRPRSPNSRASSRCSSRGEPVRYHSLENQSTSSPKSIRYRSKTIDLGYGSSYGVSPRSSTPDSTTRTNSLNVPTLNKRTRYSSTTSTASAYSDLSAAQCSILDSENESIQFESESSFAFSEGCSDDYFDIDDSPFIDEYDYNEPREDTLVQKSRISIIDLAGSERITESNIDSERLKEVQKINLSLLELGNVISALTSGKKKKHIPYRNSVLTRLLQDSLGGNCKTTFLLCVSTKEKDAYETKCTLEFGQKLRKICTKPVLNMDVDYKKKYDDLMKKMEIKDYEAKLIDVEHSRLYQLEKEAEKVEEEKYKMMQLDQDSVNHQNIEEIQKQIDYNDEMLKKKEKEFLDLESKYHHLLEESKKMVLCKKLECSDAATNTSLPNPLENFVDKNKNDVMTNTSSTMNSDVINNEDEEYKELKKKYSCLLQESKKVIRQNEKVDATTNTSSDALLKTISINHNDVNDVDASNIENNELLDVKFKNNYTISGKRKATIDCSTNTSYHDLSIKGFDDDDDLNISPSDNLINEELLDLQTKYKALLEELELLTIHKEENTNDAATNTTYVDYDDDNCTRNGDKQKSKPDGNGSVTQTQNNENVSNNSININLTNSDTTKGLSQISSTRDIGTGSTHSQSIQTESQISVKHDDSFSKIIEIEKNQFDLEMKKSDISQNRIEESKTDLQETPQTQNINDDNDQNISLADLENRDRRKSVHPEVKRQSLYPLPVMVIHVPDESSIETRDSATNTDYDTIQSPYTPNKIKTCDNSTCTRDEELINEIFVEPIQKPFNNRLKAPIVVTFLQSPKAEAEVKHFLLKDASFDKVDIKSGDGFSKIVNFKDSWEASNVKSALKLWLFRLQQSLNHQDNDTKVINDDLTSTLIELFEMLFSMFFEENTFVNDSQKSSFGNEKILILQEYLNERRESMENELLSYFKDYSRFNEHPISNENILPLLIDNMLDDMIISTTTDINKLHSMLNLVLADHTINACLIALLKYSKELRHIPLYETVEQKSPPRPSRPAARNSSPSPENSYEDFSHQRNSYISVDRGDKKRFLSRVLCMPFKSKKSNESKKKKYSKNERKNNGKYKM